MNTTTSNTNTRPPSIVETERLLLRAPGLEDAIGLLALARDDEPFARSTVGHEPNTLEGACTAIVRMLQDRALGAGAWWVVTEKRTGAIIGLAGFSAPLGRGGLLATLASECTGRGYASEAIRALARFELRGLNGGETDAGPSVAPGANWYWRCKASSSSRDAPRCA